MICSSCGKDEMQCFYAQADDFCFECSNCGNCVN